MRAYWELAVRGYRRKAVYLGAAVAGVFTNSIFGIMRGYVLLALVHARGTVGGYDAADTLTYVWLVQGLLAVVEVYGWVDIGERVVRGDVAVDLGRPIDFQALWLADDLGRALYQLLFRGVPPFLIGMLLFHVRLPASPLTALAFAVSVALAVVVSFGIRFLINLSSFWFVDYRGIVNFVTLSGTLLSGFVVPLTFFPAQLRTAIEALPFAALFQLPIDVYLGKEAGPGLLGALAFQAVWAIVLLAAGRLVLALGTRKLVIQGG